MGLLDVFSGKQTLGQWLTGRSPEESFVSQNTEAVENVVATINSISKESLTTAKEEIYAAFERLNNVPGVANYIGTFDPTQYDEYFEYIGETISNIATTMDSNAQDIIDYDKAGTGTKFAATLGMILAKPAEGLLSVVEDFGDGVLSIVGFVSGIIPGVGKDIQNGISKVVQSEWSHDIFQYDKWAKYSAITEDSAIGNGLRITGKVAGYVVGGYLMAGAMGLSTTATYGTGLLKASGATWGGTALAGITGIGSGTEEGLNLDLNYNQAFKHGLGQGAKQAAVAFAVGSTFDRISAAKAAKAAKNEAASAGKEALKEGSDGAVAGGSKEGIKLLTGKVAGESTDEVLEGTAKETAKNTVGKTLGESADEVAEGAAKEGSKTGFRQTVSKKLGDTLSGAKQKVSNLAGKAGNVAGNVKKPFVYVAANGGAKGIAANGGVSFGAVLGQGAGGIASELAGAATSEIHNRIMAPELETYNNLGDLAEKIDNGNPLVDGFTPADPSNVPDDDQIPVPPSDGDDDSGGSTGTPGPVDTSDGGGSTYTPSPVSDGGTTYTPTPDPIVDPTPEKTVDPTPEKTVDPTPEKTVDPTPEKTVDPTSEQKPETTVNPKSETVYVVKPSSGVTPSASPGGGYVSSGNTTTTTAHSGAEYNGSDVELDSLELENADMLDALDDEMDDTSSSIDNIINNNSNKYNKIPTSPTPINTKSKSSGSVVPVAVGLSVAAAAGLGAKAYMDYKRNNEMSEDEEYDEEYDDFESEEWNGDENTVELDYSEANPTDAVVEDHYLEEDNFYQDEDSGYSARNASELAELQ